MTFRRQKGHSARYAVLKLDSYVLQCAKTLNTDYPAYVRCISLHRKKSGRTQFSRKRYKKFAICVQLVVSKRNM